MHGVGLIFEQKVTKETKTDLARAALSSGSAAFVAARRMRSAWYPLGTCSSFPSLPSVQGSFAPISISVEIPSTSLTTWKLNSGCMVWDSSLNRR